MDKNMFHQQRYQAVKNIVSEEIVSIVTQYVLLDELNSFQPEDQNAQVPGSHSIYSDLLMETLLLKLTPSIEYVTEKKLLPTYTYYRVYKPGQELKPHTDRESCEISASISFGRDYKEANGKYSWPMFVENNPIHLEPGDAIVYKGIEAKHWREKFDAPNYSYHVQGFFHWVDADGPYAEWALDKRLFIGQKNKSSAGQPLGGKPYIFSTK